MTLTVAPVVVAASLTVAKIGMPSKSSPAFFGLTPATKQALPLAYSRHMRVWNCPVLPVMPCVMTRVVLSIRMLMVCLGLLERGHHGLGGLGHRIGADDRQAGIGEQLLAEFLVRALHAHDQRHREVGGLAGGDDAFGDRVAAHDAAEDVDEDRLHLRVAQHDLEGLGDLLGGSAAAHVAVSYTHL